MKDIIIEPATVFDFKPADFVPFKDKEVCDRVRKLSGKDLEKREPWWHPEFNVKVMMNPHPVLIATLFARLKEASEAGRKFTMILGNPEPDTYIPLAQLINYFQVDCSKVHIFAEDEWADEDGNIAPLSYKAGFGNAFYRFMISGILDLGFKEENFIYHTNKVTPDMSKMIEEDGEADCVYSGPGWPGHLAFIDPVEDWFCPTMEEYLAQGSKITSLHPLTIAQNSLHGGFGLSGDISKVPPKGAMIGPRDVMKAKNVIDTHGITTAGSRVTWQRLTSRMCIFGEPSQEVPESILQLRDKPTRIIMSYNNASTIMDEEFFQY